MVNATHYVRGPALAIAAILIAGILVGAVRAAPPPDRVRKQQAIEIMRLAVQAREEQRYLDAIKLVEEAHRLYPHPARLALTGELRIRTGQIDLAIVDLTLALEDRALRPEDRLKAEERLAIARKVSGLMRASDDARARGDLVSAAGNYEQAFGLAQSGVYLIEAAGYWELAGHLDIAEGRLLDLTGRKDLTPDQLRRVQESLTRVRTLRAVGPVMEVDPVVEAPSSVPPELVVPASKPTSPVRTADIGAPREPAKSERPPPPGPGRPPPESGLGTGTWMLIGSGVALMAGGIVSYMFGIQDHNTVEERMSESVPFYKNEDVSVSYWGRGSVVERAERGTLLKTIGVSAGATGLGLLLVSAIVGAVDDDHREQGARFELTPGPVGAEVGVGISARL